MDSPIGEDLFFHNLHLLQLQDPALAEKVGQLNASSHLKQALTQRNEPNLEVDQEGRSFFIHDPAGAQQEAASLFNQFSLDSIHVLYVFGVGLGYFYEIALPWLNADPDRCLVFLESDQEIIYQLLKTKRGTAILSHLQVDLYDVSSLGSNPWLSMDIAQQYLFQTYQFVSLPSYLREYREKADLLQRHLSIKMADNQSAYTEMAHFGVLPLSHFYYNLFELPQSYEGEALFGKFKNVPAILCGAGPSLIQTIPSLKPLYNRALLFGLGTSMNILNAHAIWPHFGVNIDDHAATYHRIMTNKAFETPTFYRQKTFHEAVAALHGPRLFLSGPSIYSVADWYNQELGLKPNPLQPSHSVMQAALQIAYHMGCNPIIFVGQDLSFTSGRHYAPGLEPHPLYASSQADLGAPIRMENDKGEPRWTYWPWIEEASGIDHFSRTHPDCTFINASEEGLGLFSIPRVSLEEVASQYLHQTYDFTSQIHQAIQEAGLVPVNREQIQQSVLRFAAKIKICETLCGESLRHLYLKQPVPAAITDQLHQEAGFEFFLKDFQDFYDMSCSRERRNLARLNEEAQEALRISLQIGSFSFLYQAMQIHLKIIENVLNAQKQGQKQKVASPEIDISPIQFKHRLYDASGSLYSLQPEEQETREGIYLYYYPDGNVKTWIEYRGGHPHGAVKLYYPHGQIKRELNFDGGKRHGMERSWYESGQLLTEIYYEQNEPKWAKAWLPDGTLARHWLPSETSDKE